MATVNSYKRRRLATALGLSAILIVFAVFKLPALVASRIETAISKATGKVCEIDGLHLGRTVKAKIITLADIDSSKPLVVVNELTISPDWKAILSGSVRISSISAAEIRVTGDPRPPKVAPGTSPPPAARRANWLVDELRLPSIVVAMNGIEFSATVEARSVTPDGLSELDADGISTTPPLRVNIRATGLVNAHPLTRGEWRIEGGGAVPFDFLASRGLDTTVLSRLPGGQESRRGEAAGDGASRAYDWKLLVEKGETALALGGEIRSAGSAELLASVSASLGLDTTFSIAEGSSLVVRDIRIAGAAPADVTVTADGDLAEGYSLLVKSAEMLLDLHLDPRDRLASFEARGAVPSIGKLERGRVDLHGELVDSDGEWQARLDGRAAGSVAAGAGDVNFAVDGRATARRDVIRESEPENEVAWLRSLIAAGREIFDLRSWSLEGVFSEASVSGIGRKGKWSVDAGGFVIGAEKGEFFMRRSEAAVVAFGGRTYEIMGSYRESGGHGEAYDVSIAGIPLTVSLDREGRQLKRADLSVGPAKMSEMAGLLPAELAEVLRQSEVDGELSGRLAYDAVRKELDGEVVLDLKRFRYPANGVLVDNLEVRIPVKQRLVDPMSIKFDDSTRYPEIPANISIERLGRHNVVATGITGKAYFSDFVLRVWDISFDLLGSKTTSIFILDPFRRPDGKWRSIIEIDIDGLSLRDVYKGFVGAGKPAESIKGGVSAFVQAEWLNADPDTFYLWFEGDGPGVLGGHVIKALNELQAPSSRLPTIGLLFIGDYKYESLLLQAFLPPSKSDIVARFEIKSPDEPLLKRVKIDAPLYTILKGLPFEVAAGINRGE